MKTVTKQPGARCEMCYYGEHDVREIHNTSQGYPPICLCAECRQEDCRLDKLFSKRER